MMIMILVGIVCGTILSVILIWFGQDDYHGINFISLVIGVFLAIAVGIISVVYCIGIWYWFSADYKAQIINREYKTNYTREEVFFGSDVIETIRQFDRNRYELNGNLFQEKKSK